MKKIILILTFFTFLIANAQRQKASIVFNDGTIKYGLAKIRENSLTVKFRKEKKAKKEIFDFINLKSITISEYDGDVTYEIKYKKVKKYVEEKDEDDDDYYDDKEQSKDEYTEDSYPYLLEVIIKGEVNLYLKQTTHTTMGANGMMMGSSTSYTYYVSRKNENNVVVIAYLNTLNIGKSFKKTAMEYFSDCSELVEKIKRKKFKKRHIKDVVSFYNNKCHK